MSDPIELPVVAPPVWENIPPDLAQRQQWVLWKFEAPRQGATKPAKVPYYVQGGRRTGGQGSDGDRMRLATLEVVRRAYSKGNWSGIGFAFLPDDGLIGIDIDGAIDPATGEVSALCLEAIRQCDSFTEWSPSGKGVHIYVQGEAVKTFKHNGIGLEVFCGSQFFTVTANHWANTPAAVRPVRPQAVQWLHDQVEAAKERDAAAKVQAREDARAAAGPAARPPGGGDRAGHDGGGDDFTRVNAAAMQSFDLWVPQLIPAARPYQGGYRATSKDLGRDLQEDLSIHPNGIQDFGLEQTYSPVNLVMAWLPADKPKAALVWLAARLGVELSKGNRPRAVQSAEKKSKVSASAGERKGTGAGAGNGNGNGGDGGHTFGGGDGDDGEPDLIRHRNKPVDCRENVLYCLRDDPALKGIVRLNTFTELHERSRDTPWGRPPGEWDEEDDLMLGEYMAQRWSLLIKGATTLRNGVLMAAREHKYNPIKDLIKSQAWDGTQRLERWLTDVFKVQSTPYTQLIGRCFIMGMVMRAMRPGCKFDYMLILKGEQGVSKSTAFRLLAEPWFTDNAIRVGDKDSLMAMQLVWIAESAELESLNKSETTAIKQFLSAQEDMYRPPYGAMIKKRPRHTVVVGTTNADTFLKDATGDRRFWPLEVSVVHLDVLRDIRLQLFAEALHRLRAGEQFWPTREQERELVFPEQEQFKKVESWEDYLSNYVNATAVDNKDAVDALAPRAERDFFTTMELYGKALEIKADRIDGAGQMDNRLANAMKVLGFAKHRETKGAKRLRGWLRLPVEEAPPTPTPNTTAQQPTAARRPPPHDLPL